MGESHQGHKVSKAGTRPEATPKYNEHQELTGFDHCGDSAPSLRGIGGTRSLTKAPIGSTHRPFRPEFTSAPAGVSEFDLPALQREHGGSYLMKEKKND
jgi:hypothetical protein